MGPIDGLSYTIARLLCKAVTGVSEITGFDLRTGQEEPSRDEGDVVAHQLGSALGDRIRDLAPDALIEKPIDPSRLIGGPQRLLS